MDIREVTVTIYFPYSNHVEKVLNVSGMEGINKACDFICLVKEVKEKALQFVDCVENKVSEIYVDVFTKGLQNLGVGSNTKKYRDDYLDSISEELLKMGFLDGWLYNDGGSYISPKLGGLKLSVVSGSLHVSMYNEDMFVGTRYLGDDLMDDLKGIFMDWGGFWSGKDYIIESIMLGTKDKEIELYDKLYDNICLDLESM